MTRLFARLPAIFQKSAFFLFIRIGALALQFATSILIARLIGPEAYGAYTYAFVIATTVGLVLTLGLEQLAVREMPRFTERGDAGRANGFIQALWATLAVTGVITLFGFRLAEDYGWLVLAPGWFLVAVLAIVHALSLSLSSVLTGFQYITTAQFLESLPRGLLVLGTVVTYAFLGWKLDPAHLFEITILAALPVIVVTLVMMKRARDRVFPQAAAPAYDLRLWYIASVPVAISVLAQTLKNNTDIIMVGAMLGDLETGIYRAAARGAFMITFASLIAVRVLGPMLSRAVAQDNPEEAQTLLSNAAIISAALGLPACLVLGFGAPYYLALYGPEFVEASRSMVILVLGHGFQVLTAAASILLIILHRERQVFAANLFGLIANIVLNYILIGRVGIDGAAIASAVTTVLVNSILLGVLWRHSTLNPTLLSLFGRARA